MKNTQNLICFLFICLMSSSGHTRGWKPALKSYDKNILEVKEDLRNKMKLTKISLDSFCQKSTSLATDLYFISKLVPEKVESELSKNQGTAQEDKKIELALSNRLTELSQTEKQKGLILRQRIQFHCHPLRRDQAYRNKKERKYLLNLLDDYSKTLEVIRESF